MDEEGGGVMELPTIRWCETHDLPDVWDDTIAGWDDGCAEGDWDHRTGPDGKEVWGYDCTIVEQVRLPVDFVERMKAQGLFEIQPVEPNRSRLFIWRPVEDS